MSEGEWRTGKETERQIMVGQGAVMFAVLFLLAWLGGVHWVLAVFVALLLMPAVLIAIEGIRHFFESRAKAQAAQREEEETEST
jgi:heme O synthase-like polyprenyltransferase